MGPVLLEKRSQGPFWGISGNWCWITDCKHPRLPPIDLYKAHRNRLAYHIEQFTDEYLFVSVLILRRLHLHYFKHCNRQMFLTSGVSILLYGLIFFRLRGNLCGSGWSMRFCRVNDPWRQDDDEDSQLSAVGKQMLW